MSLERVEVDVELDDGTEHHLTIGNPSLVAWDRIRAANKWPTVAEAPSLWMTYIAWHHMKHALKVIDCTYDVFESEKCVAIQAPEDTAPPVEHNEKGEAVPVVDPTPLAAVPGSPSS